MDIVLSKRFDPRLLRLEPLVIKNVASTFLNVGALKTINIVPSTAFGSRLVFQKLLLVKTFVSRIKTRCVQQRVAEQRNSHTQQQKS